MSIGSQHAQLSESALNFEIAVSRYSPDGLRSAMSATHPALEAAIKEQDADQLITYAWEPDADGIPGRLAGRGACRPADVVGAGRGGALFVPDAAGERAPGANHASRSAQSKTSSAPSAAAPVGRARDRDRLRGASSSSRRGGGVSCRARRRRRPTPRRALRRRAQD